MMSRDGFTAPPWLFIVGIISGFEVTSNVEICLLVAMMNFVMWEIRVLEGKLLYHEDF